MARVTKDYAVRRNEILDTGKRLIYTKGYEQMTVQDVIEQLKIAKGTFFYYFSSKLALLEALIEQFMDEGEAVLIPIVEDPNLPALEKLQRYFATAAQWKTTQRTYLLELLRIWYTDDNAIVRQKMLAGVIQRITPLITVIIRQGIQEGVLTPAHPEYAGQVALSLVQNLWDSLAKLLLAQDLDSDERQRRITETVAAYTLPLECVLGAPPGVLQLVDEKTIQAWVGENAA